MTDLKVSGLADGEALDTGQVVETAGVLVTTHSTFSDLLARKHIDLPSLALLVVDNIQASFHNLETAGFLGQYVTMQNTWSQHCITWSIRKTWPFHRVWKIKNDGSKQDDDNHAMS